MPRHFFFTSWALTLIVASQSSNAYTAPDSYQVTQSLSVNSAIFDSATQTILATIPSAAGPILGNTVTQLSLSGDILRSTYVGSEPSVIALSQDGSTAYVGMNGASLVRAYDVSTATAGTQIALRAGERQSAQHAVDLAVAPGDNNTVVVLTQDSLRAYTNGTILPKSIDSYYANLGTIAAGPTSTLYGYNSRSSGFEMFTFNLDSGGLSIGNISPKALSSYNVNIQYDGGLLFVSNGQVFDPQLGALAGTYMSATGPLLQVAPDTASGVTYGIDWSGNLTVFDQATFTPITSFSTGLNVVSISKLINLGGGNLAMVATDRNDQRDLYFIQAVPEPATWALYGLGLMAMLSTAKFRAGSSKQ